jgi:hypothetical protein
MARWDYGGDIMKEKTSETLAFILGILFLISMFSYNIWADRELSKAVQQIIYEIPHRK